MKRQAYLRRARHWLANRGLRGLLSEVGYRLRLRLSGQPMPGRENGNTQPHPFDVAYGTDTGGLLWGEALDPQPSKEAAYWATGYYGISPSAFHGALERCQFAWADFTFVDIGCGKGRAMLLASRFPFRRILGVELSPALAAVAQQNVLRFSAPWRLPGSTFEVFEGDATTFALPVDPLLVFLYHPFAAPMMRNFLSHLQQAAQQGPRKIILLYANPELGDLVAGTPGIEWLWKETFALTPAEGTADRFGSYGEIFSAYRVGPAETADRSRHTR